MNTTVSTACYSKDLYSSMEEQTLIEGVRSLYLEQNHDFSFDDDNDTKSTETNLTGMDETSSVVVFKWGDDASVRTAALSCSSEEEDHLIPMPVVVTEGGENASTGEADASFYELPPVTGLTDSLLVHSVSSTGPAEKVGFIENTFSMDHLYRVMQARTRALGASGPCTPLSHNENCFCFDMCDSQMDTPTYVVDGVKPPVFSGEKGSKKYATHGLSEDRTKKINALCKARLKDLPDVIADTDLHEVKMDGEVVAQYCTKCRRFTKGKSMHVAAGHVDPTGTRPLSQTNSGNATGLSDSQACDQSQKGRLWHTKAISRQHLNRKGMKQLGLPESTLFLPSYQVNLSTTKDRPLRWRVPVKQHNHFPSFPSSLVNGEHSPSIPIFWVESRHGQFTNDIKFRDQLCYYVGHFRFSHSNPGSDNKTAAQTFFSFEKFDPSLANKLKSLAACTSQKRVRWSAPQQLQNQVPIKNLVAIKQQEMCWPTKTQPLIPTRFCAAPASA